MHLGGEEGAARVHQDQAVLGVDGRHVGEGGHEGHAVGHLGQAGHGPQGMDLGGGDLAPPQAIGHGQHVMRLGHRLPFRPRDCSRTSPPRGRLVLFGPRKLHDA